MEGMAKFFGIEISMEELPIFLVFVGLGSIFVSIVGRIGGNTPLEVSEEKQAGLFLIGSGLLILGLSSYRYNMFGTSSIN